MPRGGIGLPFDIGPQREIGRIDIGRTRTVHHHMRMARGGAVGDHRHRQVGRVGREVAYLHVQHGRQSAQPLSADAQRVDLLVEFDAQLLGAIGRAPGDQILDIDSLHQRLLGQQHGLLGGTADADTQHARRAPARAHGRHSLQNPVDDGIGRVEHGELALGFAAAALGRHRDIDRVAGHQTHVDHGRCVVLGVDPLAGRVGQNRGPQFVVGMKVGAPHAFVDHVLDAQRGIPTHIHADLEKHRDDAGVLADRAMTLGAHPRIDQDLGDGVLGRRRLFALIGRGQAADIVDRVVITDVLQRVGDRLDEVVLADGGHGRRPGESAAHFSPSRPSAGARSSARAVPWAGTASGPARLRPTPDRQR